MSSAMTTRRRTAVFDDADVQEDAWITPARTPKVEQEKVSDRLADRWIRKDPLDELIDQLANTGRIAEANLVERVLSQANEFSDDQLVRALVSRNWAEDWDSEEDSVYDE